MAFPSLRYSKQRQLHEPLQSSGHSCKRDYIETHQRLGYQLLLVDGILMKVQLREVTLFINADDRARRKRRCKTTFSVVQGKVLLLHSYRLEKV